MNTLGISFTVAWDGTYRERRRSLMDAISRNAHGATWDETTSFVLIRSARSASDMLTTLYYGSGVNEALGDKLLVIDITNRTYAQRGAAYPNLLSSFFPAQDLGTILGNALARR